MSSPPNVLTPAQQEVLKKVSQEAEGKPYLQRVAMLSLALLQETEREALAEKSPAPASDAADSVGGSTLTSPTLVGTPSPTQFTEARFHPIPAYALPRQRSPSTGSDSDVPMWELNSASRVSDRPPQHPPSRWMGDVNPGSTSDSDTDHPPRKRMRVSSPARQADDDIEMPDRTTESPAPSDANRRAIASVVYHEDQMANTRGTLAEGYEPKRVKSWMDI